MKYRWYSPKCGAYYGPLFSDLETARRAVNVAFLEGAVLPDGRDMDGDWVAAVNDSCSIVLPGPVTNGQLQAMLSSALYNWSFGSEVDERYAKVDGPLRAMLGAEVDPLEIARNVASPEDWDGLMEWMASLAKQEE
jgi:hypothetical protein